MRTGQGSGPNTVLAVRGDRFVATAAEIGFPILTRTVIDQDTIIIAHITSATPGSRWCEIDLQPGMRLLYAPDAEHTGLNQEGLSFEFVAANQGNLASLAEHLGREFRPPQSGEVSVLQPSATNGAVISALSVLVDDARNGVAPGLDTADDLVVSLANASSSAPVWRPVRLRRGSRLDSRQIVMRCIDYTEAAGWIPSIEELCVVAIVSERRLRAAFADTYETSPTRFFRIWALNRARERLVCSEPEGVLVRDVARDVGFAHIGRFALRYRELFGEHPRDTLQRPPALSPVPPQRNGSRRHGADSTPRGACF